MSSGFRRPGRKQALFVMPTTGRTEIITGAGPLLASYDLVLCDIWGVLHDGVREYRAAGAALERYRSAGGIVVLLSNSPAPSAQVAGIVASKDVRRSSYDWIVSSGDLARVRMRNLGCARVHHIGPSRDLPLFEGQPVTLVAPEQAEAIVATGLVDDHNERPEDYRGALTNAARLDLPMICANPDRIVDVGGTLLACAGALGDVYESLGGTVYWEGKPMPHAYDTAIATAQAAAGRPFDRRRILAIGDSMATDMAGAATAGLDAILIAQGIHRDTLICNGAIDATRLAVLTSGTTHAPLAAMTELTW